MIIEENVPLAPLTTFKIGGPARFFSTVQSVDEVREALAFARERSLPVFVLGSGSNILIADEGFLGLVVRVEIPEVVFEERADKILVTVGSGVVWDDFVEQTVEQGYAGIESLSGIPGTVGGAVVANLGAYGAQLSDVLVSVKVLDLRDGKGEVQTFSKRDCDFSYHDSVFGKTSGRYFVLEATLMLTKKSTPDFSYKDHRFNFIDIMAAEQLPRTLVGLRAAVLTIREKKGVLERCYKSAGSFFHMMTVPEVQYANIVAQAKILNPTLEERLRPWAWQQKNGDYRIASAFLLEFTDFPKGFVRGSVGVSPKHQLSIINLGGATAADVAALARDMHDAVQQLFGLSLEREVQYVGNVENKK